MPGKLSLYDVTIPILIRHCKQTNTMIDKAISHAASHPEMSEAKIASAKIVDDMKPLPYQIQTMSNASKFLVQRLAEMHTDVVWEDDEVTLQQCQERLHKTIEMLKAVPKAKLETDGLEDKDVLLKTGMGEFHLSGRSYCLDYTMPNFFFGEMTVYNLLRMNGVNVGKMDYLGKELLVTAKKD